MAKLPPLEPRNSSGRFPASTQGTKAESFRPASNLSRSYEPEPYRYSVDFRRQLKARSMYALIPIQLIRESTLRIGEPTDENRRTLTPLSDRAWNVASAAYYKAGGKPWRLSTARDGVCYVGLVYHRTPREMGTGRPAAPHRCSLTRGTG